LSETILESNTPPGFQKGKAIGIVSILTVTVAVLGYVREAALAAHFGVSATMDAYFAAIFVPNILYFVLITGMLSPIFIPILAQDSAFEDRNRISDTFSNVANFVLLILLCTTGICVLTAKYWLPRLFAGFSTETTALAVHLTYIVFPAVLLLGVSGILTAVLNGFHRFALAAFAPALGSIAIISAVVVARGENAIYLVAAATAAGFVLQGLILMPATRALGVRYSPVLRLNHPAIRQVLKLGLPLFLYLAIANASAFVERSLASRLSAGAVATLSYALRLFLVPANFLVTPLATVVYPGLAREAAREGHGDLRKQMVQTLRIVFFIFLPAALWVVLNALPITRLLYERGQFQPHDSLVISRVLAIYGAAVLPYAATMITLRCLYAIQDTMTPLKAELVDLAYFIIAAPFLTHRYGITGLAVSRAITFYLVGTIVLFVLAGKLGLRKITRKGLSFLLRTALATIVMGLATWASWHWLHPYFDKANTWLRLALIGLQLISGGAAFLGAALALKIDEGRRVLTIARDLASNAFFRTR
jgi:putative peptidoglycan lipid II flippase